MTAVLTPGYAPFEQYSEKGRQGPWTDVYALGAVAYEALSGRVPEEAITRMEDDTLRPVSSVVAHGVSPGFAAAIGSALALRGQDRPQSLEDWRAELAVRGGGYEDLLTGRGGAADRVAEQHAAEAAAEAERKRLAALRAPGQVFRDCDTCPEMVVIPAGTFQIGSPASEEDRSDNEGPRRRVTLRSFALGVKEVTFDEWDACVRGGGCDGYRPDDRGWGRGARPVINVSWKDAQAYVSWLSEITGAQYRLPSESEWEYAARAGTTTPFHTGATISTDQANYNGSYDGGTYRRRTTPVGTFAPNAFGLYDVHGNVWEWVEDCWHDDYRGAPSDGTAWTRGGNCGRRVLRGGSWGNSPRDVRSAGRHWLTTGRRFAGAGFRVSRTLD